MKHSVEQKIKEIVQRVFDNNDLELVRTNITSSKQSYVIGVFIDKDGGVTHKDCVEISRAVETLLEADDFIPAAYLLEVSSPGLERELFSLKDFEKFTGKLAKVKTNVEINGQKVFRGRIEGIEGDEIIFADKTKGTVRFLFSMIGKANLEIDLEEELKNSGKR